MRVWDIIISITVADPRFQHIPWKEEDHMLKPFMRTHIRYANTTRRKRLNQLTGNISFEAISA
ncbi:hypothetical protein BIFCAT_01777 [Bifidobacterium catenulatum DSM 16992 = JCM 1194 = LMG 11043]|uniref:Uncharacterized protein n=1 Tax=Bifidobacterium catenulatum DSM 16992 = JCM 1194 = LMG 11043 TaxID=566552 RepID=B6XXA3_9BIFI|nr:hypothetical protein BIFCAT_01777 [Bifidobacterium catenulatum DSM 16992 = JCM 1194 = LMG 11043]